MTKHLTAVATILLVLASMPAYAQSAGIEVSKVSGQITVDGAPYKGAPLKIGDVVVSGINSTGVLSFPDGCQVSVNPGTTVIIGASSPCAAAASGNTTANPTVVTAGNIATIAPSATIVTVGSIVIIGAGATAIIAVSQNKQASP